MKIAKYFLLGSLSFLFVKANSQSVKWADEYQNDCKQQVSEVAGYTSQSVFLIKRSLGIFSSPKIFIDRYDLPDMKKVYTKELWGTDDGSDKGKLLHIDRMFCLNQGVIVTATNHDNTAIYAMQYRTEDGSLLDSKKVTLAEMDPKNKEQADFHFEISKDGNTLIGYYVSTKSPVIHIMAFDAGLNVKWNKNITPSFSNNDYDIEQVCSLAGNEVGLLVNVTESGKEKKEHYVTLYYNHKTDSKFETKMDIGEDKIMAGIKFDMDSEGNPVAAGMYKNPKRFGLFGTFGFRIEATSGKILASATTAFTKDFLTNFESERLADQGKGIEDLQVNEIYMTDDNSIVIASERNTVSQGSSTSYNYNPSMINPGYAGGGSPFTGGYTSHTTSYTVYQYNDVILVKLNGKTCNIDWTSIIPKRQTTVSILRASYGITIKGKTIYVAFCDNRKNADMDPKIFKEDAGKIKTANLDDNGKYLYMTLSTVDLGTGDVERKYLTNYKEDESKLVFNATTLIALPSTIFVYRGDHKTDQGGVLTLQ